MKQKAVFLDRDGVINRTVFWQGKPRAPSTLETFEYFPGVKEAIQKLKAANFLVIVVTNQPDVSRGMQTQAIVEQMNQKVLRDLAVDAIKVCYHDDHHECECRKPKAGMLLEAAREFFIDTRKSFMIGDRESDVEAGESAGCISFLIGEEQKLKSLEDAVELILQKIT